VRFAEINLFGVYVAPISLLMVAACVITISLRCYVARFGLLRHVWQTLSTTIEEKETFETRALTAQAAVQQATANLDQARGQPRPDADPLPVNGYVTNLL
jgi:uncharacterized membrane protein